MLCRLLPHETRSGPANMALDHALLDAVDADPTSVVLRTYEWSEPTLSLGYFQKVGEFAEDPRWRDVAVVRRPSGGGALWHDREITYALIVPRTHPLAGKPADLYRAVHAAIAEAMRHRGLPARTRGPTPGGSGRDRPFLCFLDRDPEDILIGRDKIVGSAQRRRPSAVLQHGSLLLARSERTPELPGLAETAIGIEPSTDWADLIREALTTSLGLSARSGRLEERETERASSLERAFYRHSAWTNRR